MRTPKLYMMFGYPGAGKSTAAKCLEQLTGAVRLSSDEIRLELFPKPTFSVTEHAQLYAQINQRAKTLLESGKDVIYDANLNRYQHRLEKYQLCDLVNAEPILIWVQAPRDLAKNRATSLERAHLWTPHETPHDMFERVANAIEEPQDNETYVALDGTKITPDYVAAHLDLA